MAAVVMEAGMVEVGVAMVAVMVEATVVAVAEEMVAVAKVAGRRWRWWWRRWR